MMEPQDILMGFTAVSFVLLIFMMHVYPDSDDHQITVAYWSAVGVVFTAFSASTIILICFVLGAF